MLIIVDSLTAQSTEIARSTKERNKSSTRAVSDGGSDASQRQMLARCRCLTRAKARSLRMLHLWHTAFAPKTYARSRSRKSSPKNPVPFLGETAPTRESYRNDSHERAPY